MMDLSDSLCSVMKKKSFYILLVSLLLISGVCGQGNILIDSHKCIVIQVMNDTL